MRLLVATFFSVVLYSPCALASELTLAWEAPAGCPTRADVQVGIEKRLQRPVQLGPDAPLRVDAHVTAERDGFRLELITHTDSGDSRRELYTPSCNELSRATVLLASLLLSTRAAAALPPAAARSTVRDDAPARFHATAAAVLDAGRLPHIGLGMAARLGVDLSRLRIDAGALFLPTRSTAIEQLPGARVGLQLLAADLALCYAATRSSRLAPCAYLELGSLQATGQGLDENERTASLWLAGGLGAQLDVPLLSWLALRAELTLGIPVRRAQLAARDFGSVFRVPAVNGQLRVGLSTYLP